MTAEKTQQCQAGVLRAAFRVGGPGSELPHSHQAMERPPGAQATGGGLGSKHKFCVATTAKCCFLGETPCATDSLEEKQSWELHPAAAAKASLGPETCQIVSLAELHRSCGALVASRTRPLLTLPLGNAWSPPAFQGHHTILLGFWGGSSHSGSSGADRSVPTAGCTFEEDSDPNQCEYSQGEDDDFDWELIRSYLMPHLMPDLPHGECQGPPVSLGPSVPTLPLCPVLQGWAIWLLLV